MSPNQNFSEGIVYIVSAYGVSAPVQSRSPRRRRYNIRAARECSEGMEMVRRGEIYYADLSPVVGSEQGGVRPVLVVQNNVGNRYSPTVIAAAITSKLDKAKLPTHIALAADSCGLAQNSVVLLEQIRTIDKQRLKEKIGELPAVTMARVNEALLVSLGFFET